MAIWCAYNARKLRLGWSTLFPFIAVLVESGALYTAATLSALITHVVGSNAQFAVVQVLPSTVVRNIFLFPTSESNFCLIG